MSIRRDVIRRTVIHIGSDKAGSTALQAALAGHRSELAAEGVWYPDLDGRPDHLALAGGAPVPTVPPPDLGSAAVDTLVLSSEALWPLPGPRVRTLLGTVPGRDTTVLAYLRDPVDFAEAAFLQRCRQARSEPHLRALAAVRLLPARVNPIVGRAVGRLRQLETWAAEIGRVDGRGHPVRLVVRPYRPDRWAGGDIVDDACRTVGLEALGRLLADRPRPRVNPTPDLVTIHASVLVRQRLGASAQARFLDAAAKAEPADRPVPELPAGVRRRVAERATPVLARLDRLAGERLPRPGVEGRGAAEPLDGNEPTDASEAWLGLLDRRSAVRRLERVWPDFPAGAPGAG